MAERNRVQALFPQGAEPLPNPVGTAPGIWMTHRQGHVACLPGVPSEMRRMFDEQVVPRLRRLGCGGPGHRPPQDQPLRQGRVGHRVPGHGPDRPRAHPRGRHHRSDATISFRITGVGDTEEEAPRQTEPTAELIYERFGSLVVGEGTDDVAEGLFAQLARTRLHAGHRRVVHRRTDRAQVTAIPGVSPYYLGGVVSYSNESKVDCWASRPT